MRLFAISDLHLDRAENRRGLVASGSRPNDWLILAGDTGQTRSHLQWAFERLVPRWRQLIWTPGNHELWTHPKDPLDLRGEERYLALVETCREYGVLTPEDSWPEWQEEPEVVVCPLFLLYDYSFGPAGKSVDEIVEWASAADQACVDEDLLFADPYMSRAEWCHARLAEAVERLEALPSESRPILVNHWPLRRDLVRLRRIPRFAAWCGTVRTEEWHRRFRAAAVVSGHLHMRATDWRSGVRFEEVSLGYPTQWRRERGLDGYLRQIWPPPPGLDVSSEPVWHR